MDNHFENRIPEANLALRTAIRDIKIFVWAGDYQNARRVIQESYSSYREELRLAYELRREVLQAERAIRKEIPSDDEKSLTEHQLKAMNTASKNVGEIISGKTELFSLGVLASILMKLDKRISEEVNEKPQIPKGYQVKKNRGFSRQGTLFDSSTNESQSGLEHVFIPLGENKLEVRAFRFEKSAIDFDDIGNQLAHIDDLNIHKTIGSKDKTGNETYPYKYLGFSALAHVEVTILDLNRIKIYVAAENPDIVEKIATKVLQIFE
jgi:hypothetical protein